MKLSELLGRGLLELDIALAPEQQQLLLRYVELLHKWNKVYNLTAIRQPEQMVSNHLLDSLAILPHLWPKKWLDVGWGAGLPGLVLAIAKPEWTFTLIDSNSKKTSFVAQSIIELGLKNVTVNCGRVEELVAQKKFDGIVSRAFAETSDFVNQTRHLLAENGAWAAMKGLPDRDAFERLPLGVEVEKIIALSVPNLTAARSLVVLRESK